MLNQRHQPRDERLMMDSNGTYHYQSSEREGTVSITVEEAGWHYLDFAVHRLSPNDSIEVAHRDTEVAIVPLEGSMGVYAAEEVFILSRSDVFSEAPRVVYVPPGARLVIKAITSVAFAVGGAPAYGRYPVRLFEPSEMEIEIRGGGAAVRQVSHILAAPLPAERLVLYEVVAPRGTWCGWPPHCHDGFGGSPYLEETYYFRFSRPEGYALHHNYRVDEPFNEIYVARDGDLVLVPRGYHTTVASPGSHMYFLNYLAGELMNDDRARPPCFDARHAWISDAWEANPLKLPTLDQHAIRAAHRQS